MLAQLMACLVYEPSASHSLYQVGSLLPDEIAIVSFDETDFH